MFVSVAFCIIIGIFQVLGDKYKHVELNQGPVRGYTSDDDSVYSFYGIPYATAPTGEDRFKEPLPPPSWTEVLNATDNNIACLQSRLLYGTRRLNCLVVNVFTPADITETNLPVMVYIHGGAFQYGSGTEFIPTNGLVQRGLVFVSLNYRVGPHGLLCLNTEFAPGNAGAKDQVMALKWVKENIAQFGGDPENIAIAGSSAGGAFVDLHIVSPMSTGLFNKVAAESGNAFTATTSPEASMKSAEDFAKQFGVDTNGDIEKLESFYRSLSDEQLNEDVLGVGFSPCVENHKLSGLEKFLVEPPLETLKKNTYNRVTYMTGFTPYEGIILMGGYNRTAPLMQENFANFLPSDVPYSNEEDRVQKGELLKRTYFPTGEITVEGYLDFNSDVVFGYWSYAVARLQSLHSQSYLYLFTYNGTLNLLGTDEIYDAFNLTSRPGHIANSLYLHLYNIRSIYDNMTPEDDRMREKMQLLYYNFCKYGYPTDSPDPLLDNVRWLSLTPETPYYLDADEVFSVKVFPLEERFSVWDEVYGMDYLAPAHDSGETLSKSLSLLLIIATAIILRHLVI